MKKISILFALFLGNFIWVNVVFCQDKHPYEIVLDVINIKSGIVACEVGAGKGDFALRLAERVGPKGKVYANDIVENGKLDILRERAKEKGIKNIETILGTETDPMLPQNTMDAIFIVYSFHDFTQKVEMLKTIAPALKTGGQLIIFDPEIDKEEPQTKGRNRLISREHFLSIINQSPFKVNEIDDKTFPKDGPERLVIYLLSFKN